VIRSKLLRTTAFRWTAGFAAVLAIAMTLLAGFIYWQTVGYISQQVDRGISSDARSFAAEPSANLAGRLARVVSADAQRAPVAGLFDPDGHSLAGNIVALPSPLPRDDSVEAVVVQFTKNGAMERSEVRLARETLAGGNILVFGRAAAELDEINEIVTRALALAAAPLALLAIAGGALLSRATLRRVEGVQRACRQIMAGHLNQRLPVRPGADEFDQLAGIVNRMLDEIERLMLEVKGAGDAIAHDLRTPLTRIRARLDRVLVSEPPAFELQSVIEKTVNDIDQVLTTITAILRLSQIEHGLRRSCFRDIDLTDIVQGIGDLYAPIAEEKGPAFTTSVEQAPPIQGDAELMFEAVANLVDNAVKFTPPGGRVELTLTGRRNGPLVRVADTGPGIPMGDREAVLLRFYRADQSRRTPGTGLGLALVAAIVRLHEFTLTFADAEGAGCQVEISASKARITGGPQSRSRVSLR
jgi:signal transduction histidine kinase